MLNRRTMKEVIFLCYQSNVGTLLEKVRYDNKRQNSLMTVYFYFPNEMLKKHEVKVVYRDSNDKTEQIIYVLSKDKE